MVDGVVRRGPRAPVPGPGAGPGGQQQPAAAAGGGGLSGALGTILRFGFMWYMMRSFGQKQQAGGGAGAGLSANGTAAPGFAAPVYRRGDLLDMRAYLSESPFLPDDRAGARLVWVERDVPLATGDERRRVLRYAPSPRVARNVSGLFLHVSFRRAASAVGGGEDGGPMDDGGSFGKVYNLISHLPRPKNKTGVNLLGGDTATGALGPLSGGGSGGGIMPPKKKDKKKADGSDKQDPPSSSSSISIHGKQPREIIPFLRPGVGVSLVDHFQAYPRGGIPAPLAPHALLTSDGSGLLPWVWFDDFWQLRDGMYPLNASWTGEGTLAGEGGDAPVPALLAGNATEAQLRAGERLVALEYSPAPPSSDAGSEASSFLDDDDESDDSQSAFERRLSPADRERFALLRARVLSGEQPCATLELTLKPVSFWRMQIFTQMEQSFKMQVGTGLAQEGESDEIKRIFIEGNPWLLAVTMCVSLLHSVFDFLAFKNDIGFWKENKSLEGLSARSVMLNAFSQLVIFLYLLDNDTSAVVLLSAGAGTAIEFWKITKAFDVEIRPLGSFPPLRVRDRASYVESDTRKHDEVAMRYLSYVLLPLVAGYSIYALVYESHRSWYSWALGSLVGAVYAFGFILMCPQLYLNYKLKSVAHLPWRQMTYKFLNTIIDDLFAFVIKMPLLHRLSVFRDDVVFLVYLYQRWIYRVDPKRANEFGFSAEDLLAREKKQGAAGGASGGGEEEKRLLEGAAGAGGEGAAGAGGEGEGAVAGAAGTSAAAAVAGGAALRQRRKAGEGEEEKEETKEKGEEAPAKGEKKDR